MDAQITGETDELVGLSIIDNNGIEHVLDVRNSDGEITAHKQDGYPDDASKRTSEGNEHVNQARRFAKFHVYRERGHETLPPVENPDRIATFLLAVGSLDSDTFQQYFGDYYQQLRYYDGASEPIVETSEIPAGDISWLEQDIYLDCDTELAQSTAEDVAATGLFESLEETAGDSSAALLSEIEAQLADHGIDVETVTSTLGESLLEACGPLRVRWKDGPRRSNRRSKTVAGTGTGTVPDDDPDVCLQMFTNLYEFTDIDGFQQSLIHHLRCQIRDCYIGMGIAPPEDARVQGLGLYDYIGNYKMDDFYPAYNDTRVEIDDWQEEHTPEELRI
ncbi:hypothetical protein [Natrinema sp. SYSU A 869]|uniref:hypothetical protein n=1 Tax=Natrinema sp. SYSU A 869 TaxID=2871694 RepID=UPI001CA44CC7|nr:hypothetical protein [Natrinema sp. SYSU A 869]